MPAKGKFCNNDAVIAAEGGKLYEAKVLKAQNCGKIWKYFIHYQGWDRKYDSWVDEHLLAKISDAKAIESLRSSYASGVSSTLIPSKSKKNSHGSKDREEIGGKRGRPTCDDDNDFNTKKQRSSDEPDSEIVDEAEPEVISVTKGSSKKTKIQLRVEATLSRLKAKTLAESELVDEKLDEKVTVFVPMPFLLKKHVVDEWGLITKTPIEERRFLRLPREHTVERVIQSYLSENQGHGNDSYVEELMSGLQSYFDKSLPLILLYRQEREQFRAISSQMGQQRPSTIFGCEHLLRLFVKLPVLMAGIIFPRGEESKLINKFADFLKFVNQNLSTYINLEDYVPLQEASILVQPRTAKATTTERTTRRGGRRTKVDEE